MVFSFPADAVQSRIETGRTVIMPQVGNRVMHFTQKPHFIVSNPLFEG